MSLLRVNVQRIKQLLFFFIFSSELDINEEVKFEASLQTVPPRSSRFTKVNILDVRENHGFPLIESLAILKELTFGNKYHVQCSLSYIQGMHHLEVFQANQDNSEFSWEDLDKGAATCPKRIAPVLFFYESAAQNYESA